MKLPMEGGGNKVACVHTIAQVLLMMQPLISMLQGYWQCWQVNLWNCLLQDMVVSGWL